MGVRRGEEKESGASWRKHAMCGNADEERELAAEELKERKQDGGENGGKIGQIYGGWRCVEGGDREGGGDGGLREKLRN